MSPTRRNFIKAALGIGATAILPESAFAKHASVIATEKNVRWHSMVFPADVKGRSIYAIYELSPNGRLQQVIEKSNGPYPDLTYTELGRYDIAGTDERLTVRELLARMAAMDAEVNQHEK